MNKYTCLTAALLFVLYHACAQNITIDETITSPSKEIYDLLQDSKGFIWIADELGVRRYDGVSFTSYSHQLQSSLSMTDLVEDKEGRIWCHNFNGQIFYIEQEQMHLLTAYDGTKEKYFPRIAICNDELLITTSKGLFVCNTHTLNCKYITTSVAGTSSICIINNQAVLHGDSAWYVYQKNRGLVELPKDEALLASLPTYNITLQPVSNKDTVYAISNPGALLFTFTFRNNKLKLQHIEHCNSFINAVTVENGEAWIHTKTESRLLAGHPRINGYNLSCILKDRYENTWYGSLEKGLLVSYAHQPWGIIKDSTLDEKDFTKSIMQSEEYLVMGSQHGVLSVTDKKRNLKKLYMLPGGAGSVDKIDLLSKNIFLIAASAGMYLLKPATGKLRCLNNLIVVKDIAHNDTTLFVATSRGLGAVKIDTASGDVPPFDYISTIRGVLRCRAVKYNAVTKTLWISYIDGLYKWNNNKLEPVLYNRETIYASSLEYSNGKIYAGTFSGNLIVIEQDSSNKYLLHKHALGSAIIRMKMYQNYLWIFTTAGLHTFDINQEKFIYNQAMPYFKGSDVWDIAAIGQNTYFATTGQLYKVPIQKVKPVNPPSLYLRYLSINNHDTVFAKEATLSHSQNNLSFYLTTPWYNRNNIVTIHYRLASTNNDNNDTTQWYDLENNERIIQFNAIAPGGYKLTIEAGLNGNFQAASPLVYRFTIIKPWYNQWWFYVLLIATFAIVLFGLYQYRVNHLLKVETLRRKISSDLHDDVGSTISSINIYSQLIKNGQHPADYIDIIQANTAEVINSLDELVWNLNPKYDPLEQLINKMKLFALPLVSDNHIACKFNVDIQKGKTVLMPEIRTDFYLIFKEAVNNIVKHAQCSHCDISVVQAGKHLTLSINDNGKGFDLNTAGLHRNGITSMYERARKLKGSLSIISKPGNGTQLTLVTKINSI